MLIRGDARFIPLQDQSVHCVVTSPPYFGLRDYGTGKWEGGDINCDHKKVVNIDDAVATSTLGGGKKTTGHVQEGFLATCSKCGAIRVDKQIGLELSPEEYVATLVDVFREVWRVLRDDGVCWLNLGDSYSRSPGKGGSGPDGKNEERWGYGEAQRDRKWRPGSGRADGIVDGRGQRNRDGVFVDGLRSKNLIGIPWRVAFALQADGWILRSDIIWHAPNKMPESVTDRLTKSHEYVFLLTKSERYFYDYLAIAEPYAESTIKEAQSEYRGVSMLEYEEAGAQNPSDAKRSIINSIRKNPLRNKRSVWSIPTRPYAEAHFATFPPALVKPCILGGTSAYGCCAACGTPYERIIQHPDFSEQPKRKTSKDAHLRNGDRTSAGSAWQKWRDEHPSSTAGWEKQCSCETTLLSAPIVLDPFVGSGTVGLVAEQLGRRWVGIDLAYQQLSAARTAQRGLPFLASEA